MPRTDSDRVLTDEPGKRHAAFRQTLLTGKNTVHRLRAWEIGDTLWGYRTMGECAETGKTFRDGSERMIEQTAEQMAENAFEDAVDLAADGTAVFLYSATIEDIREERYNSDGEPPLKYATLSDVKVHKSHYVQQ